jgi:hypothetical protein
VPQDLALVMLAAQGQQRTAGLARLPSVNSSTAGQQSAGQRTSAGVVQAMFQDGA